MTAVPESNYFPCPHCGKQYRKLNIDYSSFACNQCGKPLVPESLGSDTDQTFPNSLPGARSKVSVDKGSVGTHAQLAAAASPELYRVNAFRITGLPVDATARDIAKQLEKMKIAEKLGAATTRQGGPLPLVPPPDLDAVRQAMQRLRDPEGRLVDEFFWFWPSPPGGTDTTSVPTGSSPVDC